MAEEFELVALANGICSLRSVDFGQTFHPVVGPAAEALTVHIAGSRLLERAQIDVEGGFTVWDVGLGAAANATAALRCLTDGYSASGNVNLLSFDRTLDALDFAIENAVALGYPSAFLAPMLTLRETGRAELSLPRASAASRLVWRLCLGDFPSILVSSERLPSPHAIFFDPYSPAVNRAMWTLETFAALHARTETKTPCLLTTYTRSTAVRVTLLLAGFYVGIGRSTGEKDQTTVAANDFDLLERPLDYAWLEKKVSASTNAAPLRSSTATLTQAPIDESDYARLQAHPQFARAASGAV